MKTRNRLISLLLLVCMIVPMLPLTFIAAFAEGLLNARVAGEDAMVAIKADSTLSAAMQGETQSYTNDGYIGIPYEVTVYYDYATHGKAKAGYMTNGATPMIVYVVNTNTERIGTDSDVSIIRSMLARGYAVVVVDYLNNEKAKSPDLDWSARKMRVKARSGGYFKDSTVFESGTYDDTLTVPAGYNVRLNDVYFELDKHGVDGTLEEIVKLWNNDFRGTKSSKIVKWVHEDGTRKTTQNGPDGSSPVWYSDAAGTVVDNANGQYTKVGYTKALTITDCVKSDGTPIDLNLYMHTVYPTNPENEVPVVVLYSSSDSLSSALNKEDRPQFEGFLFNGYAGALAEYAWIPMSRGDHYGTFSGDATGGVTGVNMTYATYTYNATQSASAAVRMLRYLALAEGDTYQFDVDHVGAYGISKTAWYTQLGAPILRNDLITKDDGLTDLEVAQHVNEKINSFVQMLLPAQCSGRTRYDNGVTASYTVDGFTVDGGELQPWAVYDGNEISSGVQANYSSCGAFLNYFEEGYAPQFITENLSDTSYTEYGQQNIMVNLCRNMNIPALWFQADIPHTFAQGLDHNYGVDIYDAFFKFMGYYLKNEAVSVSYTDPLNGAVLGTTDGITVKFVGEVSAAEIQKVTVTDASGNALTGTWTSAYGNTEWTFLADNMKGATAYTLTVPATVVGSNGVAMSKAYTASFYTRAEGDVTTLSGAATLSTSGKTVTITVPEKTADGFKLRVNVTNDAANTLYAYNAANGDLMGSVRVSGTGYHEIDVTDYLASYAEGTQIAVQFKTAKAESLEAHYESTFDSDSGHLGFKQSEITVGQEIDGALALKIVRTTDDRAGEYSVYPNMENSYTFSTNKLIKNGAAVTKEDLGRTFLITIRVYDTVSRPLHMYLNSGTQRTTERIDHDRVYYNFFTKANEWCEFTIPYTVYEMKYNWNTQVKDLYVQVTPLGGKDANPIYIDNLKVVEVFTDIDVSAISLVSTKDSGMGVQTPVGTMPFKVGSTEYATWKEAVNAAAASGATITMQSNYTLTDATKASISAKNNLVVDLNGYRLTATNASDAPIWLAATSSTEVTVTIKNGSIVLADTPLISYGSSTAAGSGKVMNVNLENLYITVAEDATTLNIISNRTVYNATDIVSNVSLTDCVIDVERENLPAKRLDGLIYFPAGDASLTVKYTFTGGKIIVNNVHDAVFSENIFTVLPNASGEYLQVLTSTNAAVPSASFKKGSEYASLKFTATENGYAVYDVVKADYSTAYGAVPNEFADATVYPFALFMDEGFVGAAKTWKDALTTARATLEKKPGGTLQILMRGDRSVDTYVGNANWLCYMNGTILLDLNGNTLHAKTASLFEAGVDANYTGNFDTTLIVKNGNILMGNNNICGVQNNTTYAKNFDVSFEKVTFSVDTENFDGSKRKHLFYAQNNCKAQVNINLTLTDCTIDLRGITTSYTVFNYYTSNDLVAANVSFIGGALIADSLSNITWYTADATDKIYFEKGSDGNYVTLSLPDGTAPAVSLPTKDGVFSFSEVVTDGSDRDVYTLKNDTTASPYGAIPAGYKESTFVIFTGGSCIGGKDTWKDTLTLVRETLNAKPGIEVQILMQKNREVTSYVGNANWLCYMNGSILLDLDGHTLTAKSTSLFELGVDANYTGSYKTKLTVKDGTILQGNGNVCGIQNNSTYAKTFEAIFENVDFGTDSAFDGSKRKNLFYAQTNCKANVDVTLTLTDCDIDVSAITTAYTIFSFASSDTFVSADITFNGGSFNVTSFDNITLSTLDTSNDTFVWGKGTGGAYTTLTLPADYTMTGVMGGVTADGINVAFEKGETIGGYTTYTLEENLLVTSYGNIPESAKDINANPFVLFDANKNYINAASSWQDAQNKARNYLNSNPGKTIYILMRQDQNNNGFKSAGVFNGTVVLDLGGHIMYRYNDSFIEANTNGLTEEQCAFTTNIVIKNGYLYAGKTTSSNGHIVAVQSHGAYDKTYNITFENVTFAVAAAYYNAEKGLNNLILCDNANATGATGVITANVLLRGCTVSMVAGEGTVVPSSARLFYGRVNNVSITIEGGSYEGTMSGMTFATLNSASSITFVKDANGKYFEFNLTGGSVPTTTFGSDRGTVTFAKASGNRYTIAVKAPECGNAFIPYEVYDDTTKYPFILYVEGKYVGGAENWNKAQAAAKTYLDANAGGTVYILMRADQSNDVWYKSDGVFNGTVVLDLGGHTMYRGANSFLELCTNGLTAEQCQFVTNIIVKNGTILAAKTANNNGHIVAVQSNNAYNKTFNVTFDNVTFGISKLNYNPEQGLFAVLIRDNGTAAGATGTVDVSFLLKDCVFDFTDSDETVVPAKDTTVIYTNPSSAQNNVDVTIAGGVFKGTHQKISFINAGENTTVTYAPNDQGEYFKYVLTSGTPKMGVVTTDKGDGYVTQIADGTYVIKPTRAQITGASVNVGTDLSIRYYVSINDATVLSDGSLSMRFTINGKTVTVTDYVIVNGEYVFTLTSIAPQQIADLITATFLAGDSEITTHTGYSIKQNCLNLLAKTASQLGISEEKYEAMKLLIADLLVYGQAAKDYTDYEGDAILPDTIIGSDILPDLTDKMTLTGNADQDLFFKSATVRFDTVNKLLVKLCANVEDASLVTVTINGTVYTLSDLTYLGSGIYCITTDALTATELSTVYTITLAYNGEVVSTLTYSVNAYAYAMANGATANAEMKELALALYRYGVSAKAYKDAQ